MPLTNDDIKRLKSLGFELEEFVVQVNGEYRLKNVNDKCVFLDDNGLCRIYEYRPFGCRAYPIIVVGNRCVPDSEVCPYVDLVDEDDIEIGCKLAKYVLSKLK